MSNASNQVSVAFEGYKSRTSKSTNLRGVVGHYQFQAVQGLPTSSIHPEAANHFDQRLPLAQERVADWATESSRYDSLRSRPIVVRNAGSRGTPATPLLIVGNQNSCAASCRPALQINSLYGATTIAFSLCPCGDSVPESSPLSTDVATNGVQRTKLSSDATDADGSKLSSALYPFISRLRPKLCQVRHQIEPKRQTNAPCHLLSGARRNPSNRLLSQLPSIARIQG